MAEIVSQCAPVAIVIVPLASLWLGRASQGVGDCALARLVLIVLVFAVLLSPLASAGPWVFAGTQVDGQEVCVMVDEFGPHWDGCSYDDAGRAYLKKDIAVGAGVGGYSVCAGVHIEPGQLLPTAYECVLNLACNADRVCSIMSRDFVALS